MSTLPTSAPTRTHPAVHVRAGRPLATTALVLGIVGLALGFLLLPLLCAVVAITMGSVGLQAVSGGRANPAVHGRLVAATACGTIALCVWIPIAVVAAVVRA